MKAAVYEGNQRFDVREIPTPEPGPGQVLVEIKYSAICGTDVHAFLYDIPPPGTVMGHEFSGTVAAVGEGVSGWKEGDQLVGGGGVAPPGKGPAWLEPRHNYRTEGFASGRKRAYAEYIVMEEWEPIPIPNGVSSEEAAVCEPCAVAVRAVRKSRLKLGDSVAVLGAGPIGLFCVQTARAAGASSVYVSEPAPARQKAALQVGADLVLDPRDADLIARIEAETDGLGPNVVFDCAGIGETVDQAATIARRDGQVVLVAVPWKPVPLLPVDWMAREVDIQTTWAQRPEDWRIALELMRQGEVTVDPLLDESGFIPLDDIQQAFEGLEKPSEQLQLVIRL